MNFFLDFFAKLFGVKRGKKITKASDFASHGHKYDFTVVRGGTEYKISLSSSIAIRNYKTFLSDRDEEIYCSCGKELKRKTVAFSYNGSGKVLHRPVLFCPKCDEEPLEFASLTWVQDGQLVFI